MSKFFCIRSKSKTNSTDMFTLGVSTATGVEGKIGQFGSGSLMSSLLWMREYGESPIYNINGTRVEFECIPERTSTNTKFNRVLQIENDVKQPLSVSLEYGQHDWKDPIMALREWISNALDQGMDIVDALCVVDSVVFDPDYVEVFIPMNGMVRKYWQDIEKFFLQYSQKEECIYIPKDKVSPCRVYRRGVFVRELEAHSLFDYNLDFPIDESRNGSSDSMIDMIMNIALGLRDADIHYYEDLLKAVRCNLDCIEVREKSWRTNVFGNWEPVLKKIVGKVKFGCQGGENEEEKIETIAAHWYGRFIRMCPDLDGYKDRGNAERNGYSIVSTPEECQKLMDELCELFGLFGMTNGKEKPKLEVFRTKNGQKPESNGLYENGIVSIYVDQIASRRTMMEELCHHYSGKSDCTREFQEFNFRLMAQMSEWFKN